MGMLSSCICSALVSVCVMKDIPIRATGSVRKDLTYQLTPFFFDSSGPVVIILSSGYEVRGFDPGRGRWIFSERKNPEYDFLRKGSKAVGPVS